MTRLGAGWLLIAALTHPATAQTIVPDTFAVLEEEFEGGTLEDWSIAPGSVLNLAATAAHSGAAGLEVTVSSAESHLVTGGARDVARAEEGYLTFWFDPNSVALNDPGTGFVPDRSIQIAAIKGPGFKNLVALRFREVGGNYMGFLEWRDATDSGQWDFLSGSFPIADAWQQITIGFRKNSWVGCWIGGTSVRAITSGITHSAPYGSVVEIGKTLSNIAIMPSGQLRFDEVSLQVPRITDLWVDASAGNDGFNGLSPGSPFATISRASDLAGAGTTVHIQPGVYREAVTPAQGGLPNEPSIYRAEQGPGSVLIRGSEASSTMNWTQLASNTIGLPPTVNPQSIWWTDLLSWQLPTAPVFVVRMGAHDAVKERLPLAREPDWQVVTDHKVSEFWWQADGGGSVAACDPSTDADPDCDSPSRSPLQLTDASNDVTPTGIEPGNLSTLPNLVGATLVARDTVRGSLRYRRSITAHSVPQGRITVDQSCTQDGGQPGLGWGSQYYVENHPALLDTAGEWWFDESSDRLYIWPPSPGDPASQNLEISRFADGFTLADLSYVSLSDLDLELFNDRLINNEHPVSHLRSVGNSITGCDLRYGRNGILLRQTVEACCHTDKRIEDYLIEDNSISFIDYLAIRVTHNWENNSNPDDWTRPGVFDVEIRDNTIREIGARPDPGADSDAGLLIRHADRITFEGNRVSDIFHDGVAFGNSVIQSPNNWGLSPSEIKTGQNLVKGNIIERACKVKSDCGALRFWGLPPDNHVFRDLLIFDNRLRDTFGWSYVAKLRDIDTTGQIDGAGGSGMYFDNVSGVHGYRNVAYNNGMAGFRFVKTWRDGTVVFFNNIAANNTQGFLLSGLFYDTHVAVDIRFLNNIVINNETYGVVLTDLDGDFTNMTIDHNLYFQNGWGSDAFNPGAMRVVQDSTDHFWQTLAEIQTNSPFETNGSSVDPELLLYELSDHDPFDGSRPDYRLLAGSAAVDAGTTDLPTSLSGLLNLFTVADTRQGSAWDQGSREGETVCSDLTIANQTVSVDQTFQTCGTLTLGPALVLNNGAKVTAQAGYAVILTPLVEIAQGATLDTIVGIIP